MLCPTCQGRRSVPCPTCHEQGIASCCDTAGSAQPAVPDRQKEALGVLRTVADRLRGHVAEQWLMGHPHPKGMTLGEYLRVAIERMEGGKII